MKTHLYDKYKSILNDCILMNINNVQHSIKIKDINVIATENDLWEPFNKGDKNYNFILGFPIQSESIYVIRVYSTELSGKELEDVHERYFDIEIDLDEYDDVYINSVIDGLKCVTWSIEKNGAIKFYNDKDQTSKPLRNCIFEYNSNNLLYNEEFNIKVFLATGEEKKILNQIEKEQR